MEKNQSQQGTEDLETIAEAADLLSVPEGARPVLVRVCHWNTTLPVFR
jgi:hypothetical protein